MMTSWVFYGFICSIILSNQESRCKMCYLHALMSVMLILILQQICVCRLLKWPTTPNARDSATSCSSCLPWCSSAPGWECILCGNVLVSKHLWTSRSHLYISNLLYHLFQHFHFRFWHLESVLLPSNSYYGYSSSVAMWTGSEWEKQMASCSLQL